MIGVPCDFKCSICGADLVAALLDSVQSRDPARIPSCTLCSGLFCADHLVVSKGVPTCESCAVEREQIESSGAVTDEDEARVVSLLRLDVEATVGPGYDADIVEFAARTRLFAHDPERYVGEVVDGVQQHLHDSHVDTTWPACPLHPNHPLWFSDGHWHCERSKTPVARLGELPARRTG
jgi:hypothetical protein